jgi:hypothetical protein
VRHFAIDGGRDHAVIVLGIHFGIHLRYIPRQKRNREFVAPCTDGVSI